MEIGDVQPFAVVVTTKKYTKQTNFIKKKRRYIYLPVREVKIPNIRYKF